MKSDSSHLAGGTSEGVSGSGVPSLHAAILDLPCDESRAPTQSREARSAYFLGCLDTRMAAAELVSGQTTEPATSAAPDLFASMGLDALPTAPSLATGAPHAE